MFPRIILLLVGLSVAVPAYAQQPPVKVNVINVCTPSADEQKELSSALAKVPAKFTFGTDYEVARGHSTLDQSTAIPGMQPLPPGTTSSADWVRIRREFPDATFFLNAQYSFSVDAKNMIETLALRVRDPKVAQADRRGDGPQCRHDSALGGEQPERHEDVHDEGVQYHHRNESDDDER